MLLQRLPTPAVSRRVQDLRSEFHGYEVFVSVDMLEGLKVILTRTRTRTLIRYRVLTPTRILTLTLIQGYDVFGSVDMLKGLKVCWEALRTLTLILTPTRTMTRTLTYGYGVFVSVDMLEGLKVQSPNPNLNPNLTLLHGYEVFVSVDMREGLAALAHVTPTRILTYSSSVHLPQPQP